MWLYVFFDLPTDTKQQRKQAYGFRKNLLKDGFTMEQFSVYIRHCSNRPNAETHIRRIREFLPNKGRVSILCVTDKQFGKMVNFYCGVEKRKKESDFPKQLEIF